MMNKHRGVIAALTLSIVLFGCGGSESGVSTEFVSPITEETGVADPVPSDVTFVDHSNAVGFYSDGSIEKAGTLPDSGPGFLKIFRLRTRAYGTETLVRTISLAASAWRAEFPVGDRVQVGDITDSNGGYVSGHASHQNGLDVDVAYLQTDRIERDPNTNGPNGSNVNFVNSGKLSSNFDLPRNWAILRNLVQRGNVGRIFVDGVIKNAFCKNAASMNPTLSATWRTEVLRRLRPYPNHANHFHMRLKCPTGHKKCVAQSEPPSGSGCSSVSETGIQEADTRTPEQIADDELGEDVG